MRVTRIASRDVAHSALPLLHVECRALASTARAFLAHFRYLVFPLCLLLAVNATPIAAQSLKPVPHDVMLKLATQLRKDVPSVADCDTKREFNFSAEARDLNGDNKPEYLLTSANDCECGQVNCSQWVYRAIDGGFQFLLEAQGYVLNSRSAMHGGYHDLESTSRNNSAVVSHERYAFNGRRYALFESTIENLDTHESKLTNVRIRFAVGKTSTTVSGVSAPAFSDSWVLDARQGQTLELSLFKLNGPVASFTVVAPGKDGGRVIADRQTKWSGKLPATGTYTILVDSDRDGKAHYSMTVGVK